MSATFVPLTDTDDIEDLLARSNDELVILFNFDPWCPVSARARSEVGRLGSRVEIIDVSTERKLTRRIEEQTGVKHESPQVLLLKDGEAVWSASHSQITTDKVERAIHENN